MMQAAPGPTLHPALERPGSEDGFCSGEAYRRRFAETSRADRFGGSMLRAQRHICGFFNTLDDQYRVLLPFIKEGFERGEKAVHIIDPKRREEPIP
jgi:hypothetical protein